MNIKILPKSIAVVGPTAAGKTKLGVVLAARFNGEIVSADSRQVYKYLDISTGKDKDDYVISKSQLPISNEIPNSNDQQITNYKLQITRIPYHLIDILEPNEEITVADFQKKAFVAIDKILKKKKLPIVVGGSPFYIYSITEGWLFTKIKQNQVLRKKLSASTLTQLQNMLKKIDPIAYKKVDINNPRRLMRAIEVCVTSGQNFEKSKPKSQPRYNFLFLGKSFSNEELKKRIKKRLEERLRDGMIEEIENIVSNNRASYEHLEKMGLEPKFISLYLQKKISRKELEDLLLKNIYHFAKRQMTWFRKDRRIQWVKDDIEAEEKVKYFLK